MTAVNEQRKLIVARITHLVARLDSVQNRLSAARVRASRQLTKKDSALVAQVAAYEKSIADLQASAEKQRAEFQGVIDKQTAQIAALNSTVDTLNTRQGRADRHGRPADDARRTRRTTSSARKDELIKKGILVAEGRKRFFLVGGAQDRAGARARSGAFTKIDRLANRTIYAARGRVRDLVAPESDVRAAAGREGRQDRRRADDRPARALLGHVALPDHRSQLSRGWQMQIGSQHARSIRRPASFTVEVGTVRF